MSREKERWAQWIAQTEAESGIALAGPGSTVPNEEQLERLYKALQQRFGEGNGGEHPHPRDAAWRRVFSVDCTAEDRLTALQTLQVKPDARFVPLLLSFSVPVTDSAREVLEGMRQPRRSELAALSDCRLLFLIKAEAADAAASEMAGTLAAMLEAEAMQQADLVFEDREWTAMELPEALTQLDEILAVGKLLQPAEHIFDGGLLGLACLVRRLPAEAAARFLKRYFPAYDLSSMDEETRDALEAFFRNGLSIADTSREIFVHRNTLVYRLDKFQRQTGLDVRRFEDALVVRLGMLLTAFQQEK